MPDRDGIPTEGEWLEGFGDEGQMVDLGGGMIVPLREMLEDDEEEDPEEAV